MEQKNTAFGAALIVIWAALAPLSDGLSKMILENTTLLWVLIGRFAAQTAMTGVLLARKKDGFSWPRQAPLAVLSRSVISILAMLSILEALRHLPLADTIAIAYIFPFLLLLFAHYILKEDITRSQILACVFGFLGVIMIAQPSFVKVGIYAVLPVITAVLFAFFQIQTRQLSPLYGPIRLSFWSSAPALVILLAYVLITSSMITASLWWMILGIGVIGALGSLVITAASYFTATARLAPIFYVELPFSIVLGYWLFGDIPNLYAWLGILIIMISGIAATIWDQSPPGHAPK